MNDEILAALDELIDVNENYTLSRDERTRALRERVAVMPVYYEPEGWKWCHRHHGVIVGLLCMARVGHGESDLRCVPVPLYVEAPDP